MSRQTNTIAVTTIGIDTGKSTLHLIGLDERGTMVLREKLARAPDPNPARECTAMPDWDRGWYWQRTMLLASYSPSVMT